MIQIQWTCGDLDEARQVCRKLLEERLVACTNILSNVESIFHWEGEIQSGKEVKVLLKTSRDLFSEVEELILASCSYDVPEILAFEVVEAHQPYIDWVASITD